MEVKLHLGWKVEGIKQFLYLILLFLMWPSDYSVLAALDIFTNTALVTGNYPFFSGHRKSAEGQRSDRAESGYASETREGSASSQRGGSAGKSGTCMLEY